MQELARLKAEHGFLLAVDDAHGTLVLGPSGGGTADMSGTCDAIDVHIGTLSKAFGTHGGFVACTTEIKTLLVNFGRAYVFSTALPAPTIAGALASLEVVRKCVSTHHAVCCAACCGPCGPFMRRGWKCVL